MAEFWGTVQSSLGGKLLDIGVRLIAAALLLVVGAWLIRKLLRLIRDTKHFRTLTPSARSFLHSFMSIALKALLAVVVIAVLGIPMASIIAVLGSVGLAIGLALQGSLSNIAGGLIIMMFKPFEVGDYVTIGEHAGTVTEIGVFFTVLTTPDNRRVVVPNAGISNKEMVNSVSGTLRRVDVDVSAPYGARAEDVFDALSRAIAAVPEILPDPAPLTMIVGYGDSAIRYQAQVWCNGADLLKTRYALNESIKRTFDASGITFPFPQLDVHIAEGRGA